MQAPVEIRYAGVVVAIAQDMRELEGGGLFLPIRDPLPVGSLVSLRSGDQDLAVRVCHVTESADLNVSGIQVRPARPDEDQMWVPSEVPKARPLRVEPVAAPVVARAPEPEPPAPESVVAQETSAPPAAREAAPVPSEASPEPSPEFSPHSPESSPHSPESPPQGTAESVVAAGGNPAAQAEPAAPVATEAALEPVALAPVAGSAGRETESIAEPAAEAVAAQESAADDGASAGSDELPPARPTQGGGSRRRTKRRR